jgi:hypothetical protein
MSDHKDFVHLPASRPQFDAQSAESLGERDVINIQSRCNQLPKEAGCV